MNVRRFGTLANEDGITESYCDAFFRTNRDVVQMTTAVPLKRLVRVNAKVSFIIVVSLKQLTISIRWKLNPNGWLPFESAIGTKVKRAPALEHESRCPKS